jgi:hypothetical protein
MAALRPVKMPPSGDRRQRLARRADDYDLAHKRRHAVDGALEHRPAEQRLGRLVAPEAGAAAAGEHDRRELFRCVSHG